MISDPNLPNFRFLQYSQDANVYLLKFYWLISQRMDYIKYLFVNGIICRLLEYHHLFL